LPIAVEAGLWGLLCASGLLLGALTAVGFYDRLSHRTVSAVMGFGGGVLIALLSVDLMEKAFVVGGMSATAIGLLLGALVFSLLNWWMARRGAKHRNRCGECVKQPSEAEHQGSGMAIALGSILDSIPESLVIGLSLLNSEKIGIGLVAGFFLANIPQGLSSSAGMRNAGRSNLYIFSIWTTILLTSGLAAAVGNLALASSGPEVLAVILAFAAGGVLAMLAESMIPEAFDHAPPMIGVITVAGFLVAFILVKGEL
jgi:ZIP family zinc transporter